MSRTSFRVNPHSVVGSSGCGFESHWSHLKISFLKNLFESRDLRDLQDLRDLICISIDLTKKLRTFLRSTGHSGPLGPYMYDYLFCFFWKFFESRDTRDLGDLIFFSVDLTKTLEHFLGPWGPLGHYIYMDIWLSLF